MLERLFNFFQSHGSSTWLAPFSMVKRKGSRFFVFILLNFVLGLLGMWTSVLLVPTFFDERFIKPEFARSLSNGSLYTFTIVFLTYSALLLLQVKTIIPTNDRIKQLKTAVVAIAIIAVILTGLGSGMQISFEALRSPSDPFREFTPADYLQIALFFIGSVLAIYCFLLASYEEELDNFAESENSTVEDLSHRASVTVRDARDIEL